MSRRRQWVGVGLATLSVLTLSACGPNPNERIAECLDTAVAIWGSEGSWKGNLKPTGAIALYQEIEGGAEIWMRVMTGSGAEADFHDRVHTCTHRGSDSIMIDNEGVDPDPEENVPSRELNDWNEKYARGWAEENIGDLVDVSTIPEH